MKRLLFFFFFFSVTNLFAQRFEGGLIGGISASQIDGDMSSGYNKPGYVFSVFAEYKFGRFYSMQSGVTLIQKGAHSPPKSSYFKTQIDELEVPLWLNIQPYQHLGATFGLNFGYIYKAYYESSYVIEKEDLGIGDFDLSYYLSLNYKINRFLTFKLAHRYSLLPITRPIQAECWRTSMFLSWFIPYPYTASPCWWTNTMAVSFEFKILKR